MLIFDNKTESQIVKALQGGSLSSIGLVEKIEKATGVTRQAIYKSLRKLKKREIVVINSKNVSLNTIWIHKIASFFEEANLNYTGFSFGESYSELEDGDSVVYRFHSFNTTDAFWAHASLVLETKVSAGETIYFYNPHEWFLVAREESELVVLNNIHEKRKNLIVYVAGDTPLDRRLERFFNHKSQQYFAGGTHLFPKENYYLNIYGDFLIEVWLDLSISKKVDDFFRNHTEVSDYEKDLLQEIIQERGFNKMKISRNRKKAEKLKSKIGKYFKVKPVEKREK